jgi:nucleotide-binding universal stress UspA family protein
MQEYSRILVPVDGSELSKKAFEKALTLSQSFGSQVTLLHVVSPTVGGVGPMGYEGAILKTDRSPLDEERTAKEVLSSYEGEVRAKGIEVTPMIKHGNPGTEIVRMAKDFDLIVMGVHGRPHLEHILMGSVADKVSHNACCPVLLIRERGCAPG